MAYQNKGIRIKFSKNLIIFIGVIFAITISIFLYDFYFPRPIKSINYNGIVLNFRADLRKAKNVPVYPSEEALYNELMHPSVENITIALKPADENAYYSLQTVELVSKLYIGYLSVGLNPHFNRQPLVVESYDNISGDVQNPIIALVHPEYSNETAIRVKDHVIFVKAKNYKDFDLATIKLLMVALRIKI